MGQQVRCHSDVVVDDPSFLEPSAWIENLIQIRDRKLTAFDVQRACVGLSSFRHGRSSTRSMTGAAVELPSYGLLASSKIVRASLTPCWIVVTTADTFR